MRRKKCPRCKGTGLWNTIKSTASDLVTRGYYAITGKQREGAPPNIRNLLEKFCNIRIKKIYICRTPIVSIIDKAINFISFGKWDQLKKKYNYDQMFHLFMILELDHPNAPYIKLEKNAVVSVDYPKSINKDCGMNVNVSHNVTVGSMFENAQTAVGADIWKYNAKTNNCQIYISNLLKHSGIMNGELDKYINQSVEEIVSSLPSFAQKIINKVTDLGATADVLINGASKYKRRKKYKKRKPNV